VVRDPQGCFQGGQLPFVSHDAQRHGGPSVPNGSRSTELRRVVECRMLTCLLRHTTSDRIYSRPASPWLFGYVKSARYDETSTGKTDSGILCICEPGNRYVCWRCAACFRRRLGNMTNANSLPPIAPQRHLFDIPDDVAFLNCAYISPLLKASVAAGEE